MSVLTPMTEDLLKLDREHLLGAPAVDGLTKADPSALPRVGPVFKPTGKLYILPIELAYCNIIRYIMYL